ncbi:MAG TPA: HepT-like ribonuclease domain-containing protein [Phycisphaerales bacterium]|nr:HepT-like ribonuclease domain-containing protein [Phycisphaerales bacterium]
MPRECGGSSIDDRVRIEHMLRAARDVRRYVTGRARTDLDTDSMLLRAVLHAIQEVGEAAANTSDAGRSRVPVLPWGKIVAMRHVLVHVYWGIDRDRVWTTATQEVPELIRLLESACQDWPLPPPSP